MNFRKLKLFFVIFSMTIFTCACSTSENEITETALQTKENSLGIEELDTTEEKTEMFLDMTHKSNMPDMITNGEAYVSVSRILDYGFDKKVNNIVIRLDKQMKK